MHAGRVRRHLHGGVSILLDRRPGTLRQLAGLGPADTSVDPHLLPALAAQEAVDGQSRRLARDVPEGLLDPADRRVDHRAAGEPAEVVHHRPEVFDVARVLADQPSLEVVDGRDRRPVRPARIGLADAVDALIGLDLDEDMIPPQADEECLDVRDPDLRAAPGLPRRLRSARGVRRGTDRQAGRHQEVTPSHRLPFSVWGSVCGSK